MRCESPSSLNSVLMLSGSQLLSEANNPRAHIDGMVLCLLPVQGLNSSGMLFLAQ